MGTQRQLFHSVEDTYKMNGIIFTWHPEFDDQASMIMTGLLAYLKTEYSDSVEQYFTPDCISMQGGQKWDVEKGGIINEDDALISDVTKNTSWWDIEDTDENKPQVILDVSNLVTTTATAQTDDTSLPTVNTSTFNPLEMPLPPLAQMLLSSPPPQSHPPESATVSSGLTLDTVANRMDSVEGSVKTVQSNMAEVQNSLNQTNHMMRQLCAHLNLNKDAARSNETSGDQS